MFCGKLKDSQPFKKIIDSLKDLVVSANFEIHEKGIQMQAIDASHVALVSFNLKENAFFNYRFQKNFILGLKLPNLNKILKCSSNNDTLILEYNEEDNNLSIKFETINNQKTSIFNLNWIELNTESLQIPEQEYSNRISMPSSEFSRICKELFSISDNVNIQTINNEIICFSVESEISKGKIELREYNSDKISERISIKINENISNNFSLSFLNTFNKASSLSDQVILHISENSPIVIEYKIGDDNGSIKYYLAPRLNDE